MPAATTSGPTHRHFLIDPPCRLAIWDASDAELPPGSHQVSAVVKEHRRGVGRPVTILEHCEPIGMKLKSARGDDHPRCLRCSGKAGVCQEPHSCGSAP